MAHHPRRGYSPLHSSSVSQAPIPTVKPGTRLGILTLQRSRLIPSQLNPPPDEPLPVGLPSQPVKPDPPSHRAHRECRVVVRTHESIREYESRAIPSRETIGEDVTVTPPPRTSTRVLDPFTPPPPCKASPLAPVKVLESLTLTGRGTYK